MRATWLPIALLSLALPAATSAQDRELHWRSLAVEARLDSAGTLHVRERHVMVFTGDWNGGERIFNVRRGHRFRLERIVRVDSATGADVELEDGDLSAVDQYSESSRHTIRWRSRLPSDPPFNQTALTYVLEYSLGNILEPLDTGEYLLDHDFAFPDHVGTIDRFTANVTIDPAWRAPEAFRGAYVADTLYPGQGYVVSAPLKYLRAGQPAGIKLGAATVARDGLLVALAIGLVIIAAGFWRRENALGRFAPLVPRASIDDAWLQSNVLDQLPEVIGASWDDRTAQPEVAAVLARLVAEKKLETEVKTTKTWIFKSEVLHLKLLVKRSALSGHELGLIEALFSGGSNVTDTNKVRERYAKSGFNPASTIEDGLKRLVKAAEGPDAPPKPSRFPTMLLLAIAIALLVHGARSDEGDALLGVAGAGVCIAAFVITVSSALLFRPRVHEMGAYALGFLVPLTALVGALVFVLIRNPMRAGHWTLAGLTIFALAIVNSVINSAKTRLSAAAIARRKRLAAAREYFRLELKQETPRLRDEWFPYLIAFGLGPHMDRWFRAFGAAGGAVSHTSGSSFGSSGSSSASPGSWSGMGGGGGFSGGGSSSSWTSALGVMAAGVSKPSSSSSGGGGGGGGGSSGGGGGGGW